MRYAQYWTLRPRDIATPQTLKPMKQVNIRSFIVCCWNATLVIVHIWVGCQSDAVTGHHESVPGLFNCQHNIYGISSNHITLCNTICFKMNSCSVEIVHSKQCLLHNSVDLSKMYLEYTKIISLPILNEMMTIPSCCDNILNIIIPKLFQTMQCLQLTPTVVVSFSFSNCYIVVS